MKSIAGSLGQLNKVIRDVRAAYERFEFYRVYQRIYQFCAVELSSFYLDVLKDRLYAEAPAGPDRRAAQFVLALMHDDLTRLLAPIIPHTADELWDYRPATPSKPASVHLAEFPAPNPEWDDDKRDARWDELLKLREQILIALEGSEKEQNDRQRPGGEGGDRHQPPGPLVTGSRAIGDALQRLGGRNRRRSRGHRRTNHGRALFACQVRAMLELSAHGRPECRTSYALCDRCVRVLKSWKARARPDEHSGIILLVEFAA